MSIWNESINYKIALFVVSNWGGNIKFSNIRSSKNSCKLRKLLGKAKEMLRETPQELQSLERSLMRQKLLILSFLQRERTTLPSGAQTKWCAVIGVWHDDTGGAGPRRRTKAPQVVRRQTAAAGGRPKIKDQRQPEEVHHGEFEASQLAGGRCCGLNLYLQSSGVAVSDECKTYFEDIKKAKKYRWVLVLVSKSLSFEQQSSPIHRYVVFYIKEEKSIVVESVGEQKHENYLLNIRRMIVCWQMGNKSASCQVEKYPIMINVWMLSNSLCDSSAVSLSPTQH